MRDVFRAPLRAAAVAAFTVGALLFLLNPPSLSGAEDLLTLLGGAVALVLLTAWATVALMGDGPDEREFERIVRLSEALVRMPSPVIPPCEFYMLVVDAFDCLLPVFLEQY